VHVAVLGWIGLAVLGTLTTLWPIVLATHIAAGTERLTRASLWPLVAVPSTPVIHKLGWVLLGGCYGRFVVLALGAISAVLRLINHDTTARDLRLESAALQQVWVSRVPRPAGCLTNMPDA
jgi:nitrite reductase (NO-forming)